MENQLSALRCANKLLYIHHLVHFFHSIPFVPSLYKEKAAVKHITQILTAGK